MKKIFNIQNIVLVLFCLVSVFVFAGCGTEGSSSVQAVFFVKDVYYVDYNVETFLDYKVYPSTSSDYAVSFPIGSNYLSEGKNFILKNGKIKVIDKSFLSITVDVKINDLKDTCEVRLREYPKSIKFEQSSKTISAGRVETLEVVGVFGSGERKCVQDEFNYKITSSDQSVIEVIDSESLIVASTGKAGESDIRVEILNSLGESQNLVAETTIVCKNNILESFAIFGNTVVKDGAELNLSMKKGDSSVVAVHYFDENEFLIDGTDFDVYLSNDSVLSLVDENGKKKLFVVGEGDVRITIYSRSDNVDGVPSKITLKVNVQYLSFAVVGENQVKNNSELSIEANQNDEFDLSFKYYDANQILLNGTDFDVNLSNEDVVSVVEEEGAKKLLILGEGEVSVTLYPTAGTVSDAPSQIIFKLKVQFSS